MLAVFRKHTISRRVERERAQQEWQFVSIVANSDRIAAGSVSVTENDDVA
jgi:hypothetical protein